MVHAIGGMMRSACIGCWFAVVVSGLSCGGAPPPPAPAPQAPAPPVVAAAPDLSEAPEPRHLVGILRWKNPEASLKTVFDWTGIRLNAVDLASEGLDKNLAGALALDAPIDAAISLDERGDDPLAPLMAVAVGVRSVDAARAAAEGLGTVTEVAPGEYKVNLRHKRKKSDRPYCLLSVAVGATPGRFVCGQRERDVEALRAYMTRTLPKRDFGTSDLHLELRMTPVIDVYGSAIHQGLRMGAALAPRKLQIGEPAFDRAIDRLSIGLSDELGTLVQDLDTLTFDLTMAPDKATTSGSLRFKTQQSWTATTLASEASRAAAPPPMFWHLPATSSAAFYYYVPEARRFEAIRRTLGDLLDGWLQHEGVSLADRTPIGALFGDNLALDSPWVIASGPFAPEAAPKKASKAPKANAPPINTLQAALTGSGWHLFGIGAPNPVTDLLKSVSAVASRPKIQSFLKSKLADLNSGDDAGRSGTKVSAVTLKPAPAPKELPKGSLAYELAITHVPATEPERLLSKAAGGEPDRLSKTAEGSTSKKQAPVTVKVHILVVPETAQTWVAIGSDRVQLTKIVLTATEAGAESATLASRQDIAALRQTKLVGAGYTTLEAMLQSWSAPAAWVDTAAARGAHDANARLASTPNKGQTPILSTDDIQTTDGTTWTLRVDVPKAVIEDAVIVAASSAIPSISRP